MEVKIKNFDKLLDSIDDKIGRDIDDLNMFEFLVDNHYTSIFKDNKDFFKERPDLLSISNEHMLHELKLLLEYFVDKEEYEKCARLKTIIDSFSLS